MQQASEQQYSPHCRLLSHFKGCLLEDVLSLKPVLCGITTYLLRHESTYLAAWRVELFLMHIVLKYFILPYFQHIIPFITLLLH
eukprot:scaffold9880_cov132-Skeletonema_marinoi.AAC.4